MKYSFLSASSKITFALAALTVAQTAIAQSAETKTDEEIASQTAVLSGGEVSASDWSVTNGYNALVATTQVSSEDEQVQANFALSYALGPAPRNKTKDGVKYVSSDIWNFALKAQVPINSPESDSLIDFKSFGVDGSASIALSYLSVSYADPISEDPFLQNLALECVRLRAVEWIDEDDSGSSDAKRTSSKTFIDEFSRRLKADATPNGLKAWPEVLDDANEALKDNPFASVAMGECQTNNLPKDNARAIITYFMSNHPRNPVYQSFQRGLPSDQVFFAGLEGSAGLNRFNVVDQTAFALSDTDRVGFDVNGHIGLLINRGNTAIRLGGGYTRAFKAQEVTTICRDQPGSTDQQCLEGQAGVPQRMNTAYADIGLRHVLNRRANGAPQLAIAPSITYIEEENDFQFRLPLYLQSSKEGGLDAGVQAIYNAATDDFGVGAFVGIPFNLTGR